MEKKQFKAESKKLLDMMINSIYTNQEIFLRELVSNASDAIDKLYYRSLTDKNISVNKDNLAIWVIPNKEERTITITDNGIGMTDRELEDNLGTIAKSGSELFKEENEKNEDISIIGQFGVGFYSSFMVSDKVVVESKSVDSNKAHRWESEGVSGYTISECDKEENGTKITLYLKPSTEEIETDSLLEEERLMDIIKKYSDYIKYPIKMNVTTKDKDDKDVITETTVNSMIPIWKKNSSEVSEEEYNDFYADKFYDYEKPLKVIHSSIEGLTSYNSLLFIPSHAPYNYYTKDYVKGLQLYSKGVMIMDKCADLLPDYFSFVKGIVDSEDIALNISRETMQQNHQVRLIAKSLESKIKKELLEMMKNNREDYENFYKAFGMQFKHGIYSSYGNEKDKLKDLLMFYSSNNDGYTTIDEYISRIKDSNKKEIYYASGESINKIKMLPNVSVLLDKGYEVLYLSEYLDEFVIKLLGEYNGYTFISALDKELDLLTDSEKEEIKKVNEDNKDLLKVCLEGLNDKVSEVRFSNNLKDYPVSLTTSGDLSLEMEKIINNMAEDSEKVKADVVMEINNNHEISKKIKKLYEEKDYDEIKKYTKILYNQGRLIMGLSIDDPNELTNLICEMISK